MIKIFDSFKYKGIDVAIFYRATETVNNIGYMFHIKNDTYIKNDWLDVDQAKDYARKEIDKLLEE